jgi:cold shock CspA family protein
LIAHRRGRVRSFDERRGMGEITSEDGDVFAFHSTAIANGSRRIAEGAQVEFDIVAGLPGCWEAAAIEKLAG